MWSATRATSVLERDGRQTALDCLHWLIKRETDVVLSKFKLYV